MRTIHREFTLREYLAVGSLLMTRLWPEESDKWQIGNLFKAIDQEAPDGMRGYALDDKATFSEWEQRINSE